MERSSRAQVHLQTTTANKSVMASVCRVIFTITVEPLMFIYMICLYYLIPAASSLYLYKVCLTVHNYPAELCKELLKANYSANSTAEENVVSQDTSAWMFYQTIVFTVPSTIVTLLLGLYSDRHGRRLPLITPFLGQAAGCLWYLIMAKYSTLHVGWMLIGAVLTGSSGGFATIIMASFSHLSVVTSEKWRTVRIVLLRAVMGIGTVLGSFTVGLLTSVDSNPVIGWEATFGAIIGLSAVGVVYAVLRFRNSGTHPQVYENLNDGDVHHRNSVRESLNVVQVLSTVCHGFPSVLQLVFVAIWFAWVMGLGEFDVLFVYAQRMGLNVSIYGYFGGYSAGVQAVAGAISIFVFKAALRMPDTIIAVIGLVSAALELLLLGVSGWTPKGSTSFLVLWWLSPLAGMFKITGPTSFRSIASGLVSTSDQSKLFSFISASDGILQLITSAIYNYVLWKLTEENYPSTSFFVSLALVLLSIMVTCVVHRMLHRSRASSGSDGLTSDM